MRSIIQFHINGIRLQGTYHQPNGCEGPLAGSRNGHKRIGILSSNAGYQPRSSRGDLAAHLADRTADLGFHSFRFDMPGVGDSSGELPSSVLAFYELVQTGGHVEYLSALKAALVANYGLDGIIYFGHCGSANTGVHATLKHPSSDILGLILMEPSWVWCRPYGTSVQTSKTPLFSQVWDRLLEGRQSARAWLVRKPGGERLTALYSQLALLGRSLSGRMQLPPNSNRPLLDDLRQLLARGMPILMLTAPHAQTRFAHFDYAEQLQSDSRATNLSVVRLIGASHSFLEGNGKQAVFEAVEGWLDSRFPGIS
jgi:pimeloyl-ACP methyl ester carboxylesterase